MISFQKRIERSAKAFQTLTAAISMRETPPSAMILEPSFFARSIASRTSLS